MDALAERIDNLAITIFENRMRYAFTDDYRESRQFSEALDEAHRIVGA